MTTLSKKLAVGVSALALSFAAVDASAFCSAAYRTYNLDQRNCMYYQTDGCGNKAYSGASYSSARFVGLALQRDCSNGKMYYQDAWGNRMYVSKVCNMKACG